MRNDHGADGNGALDGLCSKQYVCDGQRPVYDLQPVAGGCACSIDRRERRRNLLALCALLGIDRDRARAAFKSYTDAYDATNPRIALKIEHTYHVAEACDAVAREQGWSSEDIDLAWLCGLLHDMGRFEQLRRWDTFKDARARSRSIAVIMTS